MCISFIKALVRRLFSRVKVKGQPLPASTATATCSCSTETDRDSVSLLYSYSLLTYRLEPQRFVCLYRRLHRRLLQPPPLSYALRSIPKNADLVLLRFLPYTIHIHKTQVHVTHAGMSMRQPTSTAAETESLFSISIREPRSHVPRPHPRRRRPPRLYSNTRHT